jgi:hypothetical protein
VDHSRYSTPTATPTQSLLFDPNAVPQGDPFSGEVFGDLAQALDTSFQINDSLVEREKVDEGRRKLPSKKFLKLKKDTFGTIYSHKTLKEGAWEGREGYCLDMEGLEKKILDWRQSVEESDEKEQFFLLYDEL